MENPDAKRRLHLAGMLGESLRRRPLALLAGVLAFTLGGGCKEGRAQSREDWQLTVTESGKKPHTALAYSFASTAWGRRKVTIDTTAKGMTTTDRAVLTFDILARKNPGMRRFLELNLVNVVRGKTPVGPSWDHPNRIFWELTPQGRTRRLSLVDLAAESKHGLPDLHLLLRRLVPVLPERTVGPGGRWKLHRVISQPYPEKSGTGTTITKETIRYRLTQDTPSAANTKSKATSVLIEARGRAEYHSALEVIGHRINTRGNGSFVVKARLDIQKNSLITSTLTGEDRVQLTVDGHKHTTVTQTTVHLGPRKLAP